MRFILILLVGFSCARVALGIAGGTTPITAATSDYETTIAIAARDFDAAAATAAKEYVAKLRSGLEASLAAANLKESNRLKSEIKRVTDDSEEISAAPASGPAMIAARRAFENSLERAKVARERTCSSARRECVRELNNAITTAMKAKDLDEANRIKAQIDNLQTLKPRTVDLFALVVLEKDVARGAWKKTDAGLSDENGGWLGVLPTRYTPPEEYELALDFTTRYVREGGVCLLLPHRLGVGVINFPTTTASKIEVHGWDTTAGLNTSGPFFEMGKRYQIQLKVSKEKITASLNGKAVCEGVRDKSKGYQGPPFFFTGDKTVGIATLFSDIEFHSLVVKEVSGRGTIVQLPRLGDVPAIDGVLPAEKPKRVVNLLAISDPVKHAVSGNWAWEEKALIGKEVEQHTSLFRFPYHPPREYDFRVTLERVIGRPEALGLLLADGDSEVSFLLGAHENTRVGFELIKGHDILTNLDGLAPCMLTDKRKYRIVVYVREKYIAASVDGNLVSRVETDGTNLVCLPEWSVGAHALGLGQFWSSMKVYSAEVAEITGVGRIDGK